MKRLSPEQVYRNLIIHRGISGGDEYPRELGELFEVQPSTLRVWKLRGSVPLNAFVPLTKPPYNYSLNWLAFGVGDPLLPKARQEQIQLVEDFDSELVALMKEIRNRHEIRDAMIYARQSGLMEDIEKILSQPADKIKMLAQLF